MGRATVDVFRFNDYRAFLRTYHERKKAQRSGLSLRAFSRRAGLKSPNYLKLVIDGDRNLSTALALRFADACGLRGESSDYFCALVAFNQAKSADERELHQARLSGFRRYREAQKLAVAQAAYHRHWYVPAIRELVLRPDFRDDPQWIGQSLLPAISTRQATHALRTLLELGMLVRRDDGRLTQAEPLVDTPKGPLGHHVVLFHRAMMRLASESLERIPREEREVASVTLCLSEGRLQELKAELEGIESDILSRYGRDQGAERVVQLNFQLFPLSVKKG